MHSPAHILIVDDIPANILAMQALIGQRLNMSKLSRAGKLKLLQTRLAEVALTHECSWETQSKGPVSIAKHLQGLARTWGVKLPEDWLEKAKAFESEQEAEE